MGHFRLSDLAKWGQPAGRCVRCVSSRHKHRQRRRHVFNTTGETFINFRQDTGWVDHWATNQQPFIYLQTTATVDPSATLSMNMTNFGSHWPGSGYIVSAVDASGPWVIRSEWSGAIPTPIQPCDHRTFLDSEALSMAITSKQTSPP